MNTKNKLTRWLRLTSQTIATSAGGIIAISNNQTSNVTSCHDWAGISGEFQQYRVKQYRVRAVPVVLVPATGQHGVLYMIRYWGLVPTTITNIASEPSFEGFSTMEEFEYDNNWLGFPDAHLWTNVGTAIPQEQSYGVCWISNTTPAMPASTTMFSITFEFEVEFQGTY